MTTRIPPNSLSSSLETSGWTSPPSRNPLKTFVSRGLCFAVLVLKGAHWTTSKVFIPLRVVRTPRGHTLRFTTTFGLAR